ncbi:MAG: hypothetical protein LBE56_12565 [Tannerella sp.]|jgi:hypothetical protein|nr:hypothetical protein [Tannerella sp.]
MRNEFSRIRLQHKVPGRMLNRRVECGIPCKDPKTNQVKVETLWMYHVEWVFEQQFSQDKNYCLMYARSNRSSNGEVRNYGKSGNILSTGSGIREQMSVGHVTYYNQFSLKMLENALFELSTGVLGYNMRNFVLETGERGAAKFSEEALKTTSGWQSNIWMDAERLGMVGKTTSELSSNALKAGFQFTEFLFANNIRVTIKVNPFYDDVVRNKLIHPVFGGPAESYRYDIYYIGNTDEPNIQLCKINGMEEQRGFQAGPFGNPFTGEANTNFASFDEDAAVIHKMATLGAIVLDPLRTMSFIPSVLAA